MTLSKELLIYIDKKALQVLKESGVYIDKNWEPPVLLSSIFDNYEFHLKIVNLKELDSNILGAYERDTKTIYINHNMCFEKNSFTIAHELGHYFLHKGMLEEVFYRRTLAHGFGIANSELDEREAEANWFATSLLIPEELLKKVLKFTNSLSKLSFIFGVTRLVMQHRLKYLKIIL